MVAALADAVTVEAGFCRGLERHHRLAGQPGNAGACAQRHSACVRRSPRQQSTPGSRRMQISLPSPCKPVQYQPSKGCTHPLHQVVVSQGGITALWGIGGETPARRCHFSKVLLAPVLMRT